MRDRIYKLAAVIGVVLGLIVLLLWGGKITKVEATGTFIFEPNLKAKAEGCLQQFVGRSFWILPDKTVQTAILHCDTVIVSSTIHDRFPGKLIAEVKLIEPKIKVEAPDKSCIVIENSSQKDTLPAERCSSYVLPLLMGEGIESNSFVQDYSADLMLLLSENNLTAQKLELKGDKVAPWYQLTLGGGTIVYLPSSTNMKDKITVLVAALNGLNAAKERHSVIDLRFDMVTYK